ncbi:MAG: class I SAM-dependent methyltransferase [Gammaproteobacteria bacterium]|nr:class I SAM-dependent methyltransferase [Gammaproteobacteria bacterium]
MSDNADAGERKQRVTAVFNRVAPGYDKEALRFFPFRADRLIARLAPARGAKVLDVATGTGAAAIAAAQAVGPSGRVMGIDLAERMLERAQRNVEKMRLANVDLHVMDAEALEFRDGYFDIVICCFGLFFLPDMLAGLKEWRRVVRPGGTVAFTSFGAQAFQPMLGLFRARMESCGVPFTAAADRLADPEQCRALLSDVGLQDVTVNVEPLGYHLQGVEEWWDVVWNSGLRGMVERLAPERQARFKSEHLAEVGALFTAEGLWLNVETTFSVGRRPKAGRVETR